MMRKIILWCFAFALAATPVLADSQGSATGGTAGTQSTLAGGIYQTSPPTLSNNQQTGLRVDSSGNLLTSSGAGTITTITNPVGVKGADGAAIVSASNPFPVSAAPGARTLVTLDVKTVTTGGTAVTAISAGHRTAGGFIQNPPSATINLCINEIGTATGTTSSGDTVCIVPGQSYTVAPAPTAVSVISSDSSHPFSGYGMN